MTCSVSASRSILRKPALLNDGNVIGFVPRVAVRRYSVIQVDATARDAPTARPLSRQGRGLYHRHRAGRRWRHDPDLTSLTTGASTQFPGTQRLMPVIRSLTCASEGSQNVRVVQEVKAQ